jgi:hypothetical protein
MHVLIICSCGGSEVLEPVKIKIKFVVLWVTTPGYLVDDYERFEGDRYFNLQGGRLLRDILP